jgi:hypothetical protein
MLIMLSPPRSFSSLVSTMIGQHPQIYGFPELHLMMRETVGEALAWERACERFLGPPGFLRVLAELEFGGQTAENVLSAANWLEDRSHWRSKDAIEHVVALAEKATGALFCLEKSPALTFLPHTLERVRRAWPDALYVHVTRHPLTLKRSMDEFFEGSRRFGPEEKEARLASSSAIWPVTQRNILDFCASLAPGQFLRIKGEDVLEDAPRVMRQVAQWLGLRTDHEAVDRMLHPERSIYASIGPVNAPFGNDPKFMLSPAFRPGKPRLPRLDGFFASPQGQELGPERRAYLAQMASCLGYR